MLYIRPVRSTTVYASKLGLMGNTLLLKVKKLIGLSARNYIDGRTLYHYIDVMNT